MSKAAELLPLYAVVFDSMKTRGPDRLLLRVQSEALLNENETLAGEEALLAALDEPPGTNVLLARFRTELALWDAASASPWVATTSPKSDERRNLIYEKLQLSDGVRERFDELIPVAKEGGGVVVSREFQRWYANSLAERPPFYWDHYRQYLLEKSWDETAVASLDLNTTRVVERLADPERVHAYQVKGLVVGYVQSGKTANFTGVVAKAIDAGYRLVIILTGTMDLLRTQTQRRIDKELVGKENLLRGIDKDDEASLATVDYWGEPDWPSFVDHGELPSLLGRPDIYRLTTKSGDYKALKQGIEALDFTRFDPTKPLNAPDNLRRVPARVVIVKKNATVLKRLVADLKKITAKLGDIPALVIDDESDQASVNTSNPKKWKDGEKERSAINRHIADLLHLLPRGQYIGYTATPFANVFVDPSDASDIFPREFLLSLDRPPEYMGAADFHDLDGVGGDEPTYSNSNEKAYIRPVHDDEDQEELGRAIDAFVLSGAIKQYRQRSGSRATFMHHTMLVHESVRQAEQRELADTIRRIWGHGGWYTPRSRKRLEALYETDFLPVMHARAAGEPIPEFDALKDDLGQVASMIAGAENNPVWIINGDKEVAEHNLDFDARSVWKILVGGAKLSRGFTVEGLTISYYRRSTRQADTLMQMGRWFGFRAGYRDLVRLYIGRSNGSTSTYDLYRAFEAACRSEELFREEIRRYSLLIDGKPQITPGDIPPLVAQHVPWLKPSAANKMYNARLIERRSPGTRLEPTGYPSQPADLAANSHAVEPLVAAATDLISLKVSKTKEYQAYQGIVSHEALVHALVRLRWSPDDHFMADLEWLRGLKADQIEDWVVVIPQLAGTEQTRSVLGRSLSVHERSRRQDRSLFGGIADPKHRPSADRIAGNLAADDDPVARALHRERRGAVLVYPVFEVRDGKHLPDTVSQEELVMALVIASPQSTGSPDQPLVRFQAFDPSKADEAIIDIE